MNSEKNNLIESKMIELSSSTSIVTKELIRKINAFLSSFDAHTVFSFSSANTNDYEERYMLFLSGITNEISKLTSLNASLASHIIEADKAANIEATLIMQKRFDAFCLFESELYNYTEKAENAFANKQASTSFIISSTQKFKLAAENLLKENSQD